MKVGAGGDARDVGLSSMGLPPNRLDLKMLMSSLRVTPSAEVTILARVRSSIWTMSSSTKHNCAKAEWVNTGGSTDSLGEYGREYRQSGWKQKEVQTEWVNTEGSTDRLDRV